MLNITAISNIDLVLPPTDLQCQFGTAIKGTRSAVETYGKQIQNLRRTRDMLLPRLLSGQIEVEATPGSDSPFANSESETRVLS